MRTFTRFAALALLTLSLTPTAVRADQDERHGRPRPPQLSDGKAASLLMFVSEAMNCPAENPCFGYEPAYDRRGRPIGRWVPLNGDIDGLNFEPGVCAPGVLNQFFPGGFANPLNGSTCVAFGDGLEPGTFRRALPGDIAYTECNCTVGGRGDREIPDFPLAITGDILTDTLKKYERLQRAVLARRIESKFTLKIQYFEPDATYVFGHTEFDFIDGRGRLHGLRGSGILDFAGNPPITFDYGFWPR